MSKITFKAFTPLIIVFITGLAGMAIELTTLRLISSSMGTSMNIWATSIAVIMFAMALGYFVGGLLTQKIKTSENSVSWILSIAGLNIALTFFYINLVLNTNLFITLTSFFPTVFLLGTIYPLVIAGYKNQNVGETTGIVFAVSTLGSIIGTLLPSFVLIPIMGTQNILIVIALLLEGIALYSKSKLQRIIVLVIISLIVISQLLISNKGETEISSDIKQPQNTSDIVFETESIYQKISVVKIDNGYKLLLGNNNFFSSYYTKEGYITGQYFDYYNLLPLLTSHKEKYDVLIIGLGAGTISRQLEHYYGNKYELNMDGVEIDQEVVNVGKEYFELEQPHLNIYVADGRIFLKNSVNKYDLIIMDGYAKQSYVPSHLATKEFFELAKSHLKPSGIFAFNIATNSTDSARFMAITNTSKAVFNNVYYYPPSVTNNYMMMASQEVIEDFFLNNYKSDISPDLIPLLEKAQSTNPIVINKSDPAFVITDDKSPERL